MGIDDAGRILDSYPFELSGGQVQRVLLALAFGLQAQLLIADEPTTALDVTVQAEVLSIIEHSARERGLAVLLITHNLGVVGRSCSRVAVLRAGRVVEMEPTDKLFGAPTQSYTRQLLAALPSLSPPRTPLPVASSAA
jgi:peptide/nickel transport system ATP-binding protein